MSEFAITAFGAVSQDLADRKDFPKGQEVAILSSRDKAKEFLGASPAEPEFDILDAAQKFGFGRDVALSRLRETARRMSAELMRTTVGRDYLLIQSVGTLDDMNVVLNTLSTRLRELWSLHYPELSDSTADNEKFAKAVSDGKESTAESIGISLPESDTAKIRELAASIISMFKEKAEIEKYVDDLAVQIAPHASEAAGPALAARLIARAGSLERIAFMPSSTVQVLGAEKALFKHLTRGVPCPKHGLIFQHPSIQSAPKNKRGKIARQLAAKISIGARIDYFRPRE